MNYLMMSLDLSFKLVEAASRIQRQFKVGYNRAARMIDLMEKYNIIGPQQSGAKPRKC